METFFASQKRLLFLLKIACAEHPRRSSKPGSKCSNLIVSDDQVRVVSALILVCSSYLLRHVTLRLFLQNKIATAEQISSENSHENLERSRHIPSAILRR